MNNLISTLITMIIMGCAAGGGTSTGNGVVNLSTQPYTSNSTSNKVQAYAVSSLSMCFKRLRFKSTGELTSNDPSQDSSNIDLEIGNVQIDPLGSTLASVSVPYGNYERIEIDLEKDCDDISIIPSLALTNSNGSFATDDRITIKFEGLFEISSSETDLPLNLQTIINELSSVSTDNEIKSAAEAASGDI